ncbi:nesprin-2 isoform X1 [Hippoglossus stenolepis]|uniref:nesprin-2 isoform X1 n=1 Tax=Hippoglossus stenolepis TaxID=195615 RepID=UPI001FAEBEDF|nr:nesprin-2 isoform X1 [Hippoglossus stenolepis]
MAHPQTHGQGKTHIQSMAWPSQAESLTQHQTQTQHVVQPQVHSQPMTQYSTHAQPPVQLPGQILQGQLQAWTQVRASSPISVQHPQAQPQLFPQGYPQAQSPSQQWTHKHELQNQAFNQQRHPTPPSYIQQTDQASQAQAYSTVQVPPQWIQTGPQQGPQIRTPGYSHMGPLYTHPERQPQIQHQALAQTQPQMRPQSPMQQQMRSYNIVQTQGQVQPQTSVRQHQPYPPSPSQQCSQVPHQPESQHHPQTQIQIPQQSQVPHPTHPQFPSQPQVQTKLQASAQTLIHTQPPVQAKPQAQTQPPPPQPKHQTQLQPQLKIQSAAQPKGEMPSQPKPLDQLAPQPEAQSTTQTKTGSLPQSVPEVQLPPQPTVQLPTTPKDGSPQQSKSQPQTAPQPETQIPTQPKVHSQSQTKTGSLPQPVPEPQLPTQPTVQLPTTPKDGSPPQSKSQAQTAPQPETQSPSQTKVQSPTQLTSQSMPQPIPQAQPPPQPQLQAQSPPLPKAQPSTHSKVQSPPQARPQIQPLPPQPKTQQSQTIVLSQVNVLPQSQAESPDLIKPPALAQAPPQAYTEAYAKAQALARNGFEEAKHCLQEHILEAINVFRDKRISAEQVSVKEETLKTLDPELLEEFLRAAKGMEAFCTPPQLRDMEFFTQSVRSQWEAVRAEISGFLPQIRFEVTRRDFNSAAGQCEMHLSSRLDKEIQACFAVDGSFAQAGQHLQALKELCDTLSPEDAHRLAQTQLRECEKRLAAIQHQFSGDQDAPLPDPRIPVAFSEDVTTQEEHEIPQVSAEVSQVTVQTVSVERREVEKQTSVEEDITKKEALERYENCKRTIQAQLSKNEQSLKDIPSDSISLKGLHTRLQEIQFLRQETESLWSEYGNLCSQCSQLGGNTGLEQEKAELQEQWRTQQCNLQRRGSSLGAALRQVDSTENHMVDFTDRLDRYLRQPKDISAFTLANTNILKDIKELDENIQSELDQLSRLDPESSDLDPRDCFPLSREVETHRTSLDQLRQQVRKSEASARALDRFLMSLRTVDEDISGVQGAPCSDSTILQDGRSKLALIRQSIDSLKEKAPQLDLLLQGARLTVTRDGVPASCLDMVTALLRRLEEADSGLAIQQQGLVKETQNKSLGLRKRALLAELRTLQDMIETQGLKEPNIPAVHHRLRALSDLEVQLQAQHAELQNLRELQEKQGGGEHLMQELETQWKDTHKGFSDRKKRYTVLLENLKKFQSCWSHLSNTLQRVEQTIGDQASYMGKDNLQRSITKFIDIKEELTGLRERMEEMRGVSKQLQSQLKTIPDCSESAYEAEADTLMDNWLDVTEKTDACMDNLKVGLELWEKQLMLGGEVDNWAGAKLALFAASHPFYNEQDVLAMKDEIQANEENIEHFHKKSVEIQEMLQSQEAPLELQVMETQLRKRMEQVKELFTDCTDVFEELIAVKKHLAEKIDECQSAVQNVQCSLSKIDASGPNVEVQIQDLVTDLETQEQQAEAVLKEVGLVSSVASPQALEALSVDCSRLREAISRTKDMIHLKREERDKGLLKVLKDERQSFEEWFQDLQLCVNECFENPESKTDVETSLQRLTAFLKSKDAERRLDQMKVQLEKGREQIPPQQLSELSGWMKEQQEEVGTFRTHCHNRQQQMASLLSDLTSLQKQHDSFREWLQTKEKQSVASDKQRRLLKELQDESGRAETISELLASVRRQGFRAETLLKDGDNLIQRYRNLEARLQKQAKAQSDLEGECDRFDTQAESTRTWIRDLMQPLSSTGRDVQTEEMKCKAQTILSSKPEGDSKMNNLRRQSQSLCEKEELDESRKQQVLQSVREAEEQWTAALQTAEEALNKVEAQALLDKDTRAFKTQSENVQSWIRDQEQNLQSVGGHMPAEEKLQIAQATLNSKPEGESKLHDLKQQGQRLCDNQAMDDSRRREVQDAVRHGEEQWRKVMKAAEEALHKAETEAASDREFDSFKTQSEDTQTWMKEQKQKLLSLGGHMQCEQRLQVSQAVLSASPEGESKVLDLKRGGESLSDGLEQSRRSEVQQLVENAEQQWRMVLQAAGQAELRGLSDDFDTQSKDTQSWIRDRQQKLQSAGCLSPPEERCRTAQSVLGSRPEGDCQVNNLRRRGQSLCDHSDADEGRRLHVQQTVRDTEEQWRALLQAANRIKDDADAQIVKETGRRSLELREFDAHEQDTRRWLADFQQRVSSLGSRTKAEDKLLTAQDILLSKPEGDSKLQELKRRGLSLSGQDLEGQKKQEVESRVRDAEDQWTGVLQEAKQALDQAEKQCALEGRLREYETQRESTRAWLQDKRQSLVSLDAQMDPEEKIMTAQTILSSRPEGDSKLTELRRHSQSLSDQEDLEEDTRREAEQTVKDSEEQWRTVLQTAENTMKKAEVQYSLSREMEALCAQAGSTRRWVKDLQDQADSKGKGPRGSQAQLEDRLSTAQVILSSKSDGEAQVTELKRRAQSLCEQTDLEGGKKLEVQQKVSDIEEQWRTLLRSAEETHRELKGVVKQLVSCRHKRGQAEARLAELQKQTSDLPLIFPWPGLGERRQAVEQAQALLDRSTALAPVLSDVCTKAAKLFEITQDRDWADPSGAAKEESIPALLKELTAAEANLEQGILTERQCTQLVEQHEAAQDWLREHVKGLGAPPEDRQGLHGAVNTLKALLQTVDREQREMKELDSARDKLLSLCTPGGRDSLTLEVRQLHDLCDSSEQEVRERLMACELRLEELEQQAAKRGQELKERAAALQWELRSLDQALSYSEPQHNITQLQQHWHSLQNCGKSLEDLGVKVHDLHQEVKSTPSTNELPSETISVVESLCQQHDSLKSRLSEHQDACSTNTARSLTDCVQALQQWNHSKPSESISSVQVTLEEGEKLQVGLREALSHQQFLAGCLRPVVFEKLKKDGSETLRQADARRGSLTQSLKELEDKKKQKLDDIQSIDLEETKTSMMAPPRKNKRSPEKKSSKTRPLTETTTSFEEKLTLHVIEDSAKQIYQQFKNTRIHVTVERDEAEQVKAVVEEQRLIQKVNEKSVSAVREETTPVPSRRKTKALTTDTEPVQYKVETAATVILDVSKPSIPAPVSKDVAEKVDETLESSLTKSLAEQARTTAKLGDTSKDAIRSEVSLEITDAKPTPIKDDSEPITKTDAKQPMSVPKISQVITEPTEAADLDKSKLLPKKRKSKSQKPTDELDSQMSLTYKEQAEAAPMDKTIIIPSGKSEVLGLSIAPEPVLAAESSTCVVKEPEKPLEIAVLEQIEVLPPKRKSKSPNLPEKHTDQQRKGESDRVEPEDGKKEPDNLKSSSTSQEVSITTETIFKISPTKRRSKGPTLFPEQDTKEGADTKQEPDSQKPSREPPKEVVEETKVIPIRRKSKTLEVFTETEKVSPHDRISFMEPKETTQEAEKDPTVTDIVAETAVVEKSKFLPPRRKPKSSELPLQLAETEVPQTVEDPEGQKVGVATNKVSPTTRKSKGPKVSPDLPHKVETHAMEKPESLITEAAIVEETKVIPSRRKSKEHPDSQKPEVVTGPAEMVVEKVSPTKRKSKGAKHLTEVVTKDVAEITKEPDVQKSQTETVIIGTTDAKSTKSREELQSEKATSTAQVVVGVPGSTIVEEVKLLPPTRKSKDPKVSPELPHKEETQAMEKPDSQETFSITIRSAHNEPEQTKKESESPVVAMVPEALPVLQISSQQIQGPKTTSQKSELSDIKPGVNKDVKSEITVQVQGTYDVQEYSETKLATIILGTSEVFVIADTHPLKVDTPSHAEPLESISSTLPKLAVSDSQEPKDKSEKAPEQTITKSTDQSKTPETQPHLSSKPTDAPYGADYVDKLWKNTAEIQRRYLILDMPDIGIPQTRDIKEVDPKAGSDSSQPPSVVCAVAQPHDTEVDVAGISPTEQEIMKLSETLSQLKLTQERHKEDKQQGSPGTLFEKSAKIDRSHNVAEVNVLQMTTKPDINKKEIIKVSKEKEDEVDLMKESVVLCEAVPESKDVTSTNAQLEKTAVKKTVMKMQESGNEFPDTMAQPTSPASEVSTPDQEETTSEKLKVVKEQGVQEQPPTVWTYFMDEKSLKVEKIHSGPEVCILQLDIETATEEHGNQEPRIEIQTSIRSEEVPENKDKTFADVEPEKAADVMTEIKLQGIRTECQDNVTQRDSAPPTSVVSELLQPYETETEFIEINLYEQETVKSSQREIKIEFLKTTQDRTTEVKEQGVKEEHPEPSIHGMDDVTGSLDEKSVKIEKIPTEPQEHLRSGEKISPAQKSSTHVSLEEVTREEGLAARENKEEERVVKKQGVESAESSGIGRIFPEMQLLSGTGPSSEITEVKSHDDTPETLITSTTDMDERVNRLVSQILSCRNRPAELSPAAMARQVEEAQQCRESAQAQGSLLSQLRGAESTDRDSLEHLEDEWSAAAQDAAAVIQSKEAQLELVMDYGRQTQTAQTTVERQTAELDAVETSKGQSSSKEAEHLCSFQRSMEDNRTVLGELLLTFTTLCPHLSQSERSNAHTEQRNLHERWRGLERAVERSLHHTRVHSHETSSLQSEISNLREHLETIDKDLEAKSPAVTQWNCKKAQQLMEANAEVKAAKQKFLYLQKRSEALMLSSRWEKETKEIQQGLQMIQDKLSHTEELVSSQTQSSSNPIMEKIITVMRDGLAWAKQTESDIEGRRKTVALLPEEVHRQLRDLKKLQSEVMSKQGQLESLVEEVTELLPQLDQAEEVPVVRTSLQTLQKLSYSTTDKLAKAVREIESGLQTREKMSEQIADLDSWVVAHLHREASRSEDSELRNPTELDRRVRQLQETLAEADKQSAVCEALLMKSKDISSELSISEKCQLFEKLTNLQEDIRAISSYEKVNKKELDEFVQTRESNKKNLVTIEQSLRQMIGDLSRHRYPITSESLQPIEPFKHMILEHKSQVDLLQPSIPQEKTKELHSIISEIHSKLINLETKGREHEKYLGMRQRVEDLRENVREQVRQTKDDSKQLEDKYRRCQTLIVQIPLIKWLCEEARSELQTISTDLYPSQLAAEQQRLKQSDESLDTLQIMLYNNLSIIEWNLLKELDLESVKKDTEAFLSKNQQELGKVTVLEPNETAIDKEYQRILSLKKTVESRIRALEILEQKKGKRRGSKSQERSALKKSVLSECDSKMENLLQARESLRSYTRAVKVAVQFLRDIELCLLPPCGSAGPCSERLEETQEALVSLQQQFQTHVERLQSQFALHPYLSPQKTEQLQENILSQLLVRMSTLQAKGHVQLESLSRCAEHHRSFNKSQEEIFQRVKGAESSLLQFISQKPTCLTDCTDQEAKLRALSEEVQSLLRRLEELNEWCPEQSCRGGREATVTAVWKTVSRLRRCTRELAPRSKQGIAEWSDVTNSVEKASTVLELVEAELPDGSQAKASTEELHDVLQSREQYQDRLDCEHRSLSALELRAARMLGVPAHLEQAPPTPLCQQLQAMQARYSSVKQRSKEGLEASRLELQEREKVWKDLQGVRVWLEAADGLLSEMEKSSSTQELQEVHGQLFTQKALLLRIMESMKTKYSDMYTLVPVEIEGQLQEVNQSLQQVEVKVGEAVQRSGPVHRLGAKLSEIQAGLRSVQKRLEQRSPTVIEAKVTQKRVWDELDVWHSCLAALEVDMQDLDKPEEALSLTERMVEVQQRHSQLAKQAEQRTTLLSKTQTWLQEHREMISSSKSWMSEAQSWLAAPCTYTSAKCLSSHVHTLQMVLGDSAQIRTTLQGFTSVLQEMSQICDVANLHQQLVEADRQVADVQDSFTAPLSQLEHAAAEVEAIESEVKRMESEVAEIKTLLSSPETFPSPREESLKEVEKKIQTMRTTVAEIQRCKPDLCLPEKSEETLTVFTVVDQLQNLLLELEKKVPALFIQQPPTPVQTKAPSAEQTTTRPQLLKSSSEEAEKEDAEEGQIKIVHVEEDVLTRLGATLQTVEQSPPEQRISPQQPEHHGVLQAEEEQKDSEQQREEEGGGGFFWWLWEVFLGGSPEEPEVVESEESEAASGQSPEQTGEETQDVQETSDPTEASSSEALSRPPGTGSTQSLPESMVNTPSTVNVSKAASGPQQRCVVS